MNDDEPDHTERGVEMVYVLVKVTETGNGTELCFSLDC